RRLCRAAASCLALPGGGAEAGGVGAGDEDEEDHEAFDDVGDIVREGVLGDFHVVSALVEEGEEEGGGEDAERMEAAEECDGDAGVAGGGGGRGEGVAVDAEELDRAG